MFESCRPDQNENKDLDVKSRSFFLGKFLSAQHYAQQSDQQFFHQMGSEVFGTAGI